MGAIQTELHQALKDLLTEVGAKLKPEERVELEAEFRQIDEVLERLKSGYVYVAFFGKTSVGKSAIVNALLGDDVAKVGIEIDLTSEVHEFRHEPWIIVDVPGVMGREELEKLAVEEAKKAHGIIFCLDGEPAARPIRVDVRNTPRAILRLGRNVAKRAIGDQTPFSLGSVA
jgi:ribosome biogenesis GTPase A